MNKQNKSIHHQSLSLGKKDSHIHELLSPIIETVRKNKINSFFQLRTKVEEDDSNPSFIFQPYAASPVNIKAKMYMTGYSTLSHNKNHPDSSPRTAGSPIRTALTQRKEIKRPTAHTQNKKLFRINSKIKKHLVDSIDFDEIEKMLYKKRECVTHYENYLKNKAKKKSADNSPKKPEPKKNQVTINPENQTIDPARETFYQTMPLRSVNKKKFFVKEQSRRKRSISSCLEMVEGKSFITIQH